MKLKFVKEYIKNNLKFFLSLVICSSICFSTFVTFSHVKTSMEEGLNTYLDSYNYFDGLVQPYFGEFTEDEVEKINSIPEIKSIRQGYSLDSIISDDDKFRYVRLLGTNLKDYKFYIVEDSPDGDLYLSATFAKLNNYHAGDKITLKVNNNDVTFKVKSIINSPEVMGAVRTITYSLELSSLGFAYIDINNLSKYINTQNPNTICYYLNNKENDLLVSQKIESIFENRQIYFEKNDSLIAKTNIKNDLEVLSPIATYLPILVYIIGLIISILFIRQFINTKLKDIGILKSNGVSNLSILSIFILYGLFISIISTLLGIILSIFQIRIYTNFYTLANYLPRFTIINNYKIIFIAFIICTLTSIISIMINIKSITKIDLLNIINDNITTTKIKFSIFKNKIISTKPFISSIFNKPFRFIFLTINMVLVVIIITASVGVKSSKDNSIKYIYDKTVNYNYIIHYHSYIDLPNNYDNSFKELLVNINDEYYEKLYVLNNTNFINIYDFNDNLITLDDGIILSSSIASKINANIGDYITVNEKRVKVTNISKEVTDYKSYMSYNTYNELFSNNTSNAYFINDNINSYNLNDSRIYYISNTELLKNDLIDKFSYISEYILIIIGISSLISIIVIFNMSVIYYEERYKENKVLRTIGYSKIKIIVYSLYEIVIQSLISIIIGIPIGYLCSKFTISKINNDNITMYSNFKDLPILNIIIFIILVSIIGRIIASHNKIKLVDDNE